MYLKNFLHFFKSSVGVIIEEAASETLKLVDLSVNGHVEARIQESPWKRD